ncbi:MAG: NINE protein [Bacteroidia bacterium]|nr:NINE protein [Bacteroidia bacterium]
MQKQTKVSSSKIKLSREKRKIVVLLLCLLLGWLALHRWYLGTSDRPRFVFTLVYFLLSLFFYIHVLLDFVCILFTGMDFYLDNPGIFIWVMIFFK